MTREELVYMNHFNNKEYDELTKYFDDIVVEYFDNLPWKQNPKTLHGKDESLQTMNLHRTVRSSSISALSFDGEHLIVEPYTEFHALETRSAGRKRASASRQTGMLRFRRTEDSAIYALLISGPRSRTKKIRPRTWP